MLARSSAFRPQDLDPRQLRRRYPTSLHHPVTRRSVAPRRLRSSRTRVWQVRSPLTIRPGFLDLALHQAFQRPPPSHPPEVRLLEAGLARHHQADNNTALRRPQDNSAHNHPHPRTALHRPPTGNSALLRLLEVDSVRLRQEDNNTALRLQAVNTALRPKVDNTVVLRRVAP